MAPRARRDLSKLWRAGTLRATAFYVGQVDLKNVQWWESLTGLQSESRNVRQGSGQLFEYGAVGDRMLHLVVQPSRIDWILLPKEHPDSTEFQFLGEFAAVISYFGTLLSTWFSSSPLLNRLAFGGLLHIPTDNQVDAIKILAEALIDVKINWTGIQDFVFQLNRPLDCHVVPSAGPVNRVVKWQTMVQKKLVAPVIPTGQGTVKVSEQISACLELDISTADPVDPGRPLPNDRLKPLFDELLERSAEIVTEGKLP